MPRVNKVVCPHCGAALKSGRGIRIGRTIPCPQCAAFFTVPEDGGVAGEWDAGRLLLAVLVVLFYLSGGALLGCYCWTLNVQKTAAAAPGPPLAETDAANPGDEPPAPPPPAPPARKPTAPMDPADELKVDNALIKGTWYLKRSQQVNGAWGDALPDHQIVPVGYTALPALALLECGVPTDDPAIVRAAAFVRVEAPKLSPNVSYDTYQAALTILFLDRLGDPKDKELIQLQALRLIAGQRADDWGWGYASAPMDVKEVPNLLKKLRDPKVSLDQWRSEAFKGQAFDPGRSDNSNTQFAVLALWVAAQRHDVPIERTIALVEQRFRTTQLPAGPDPGQHMLNLEGAWPYNAESGTSSSVWPTMTAAGLLGLAVAHGVTTDPAKQKQNPLDDRNIQLGLAMVGREINRPEESRTIDLYFLWSVERVGVIYNLRTIGKEDWYAWGRKLLLAAQKPDGHWQDGAYYNNNAIHDTCFALLFLKQANLAQELSDKFELLEKEKK